MFSKNWKGRNNPPGPSPSDFDGLPYPRVRWYPQFFFMKMTAKDVKEITYMPLVTFFSVLERPWKYRKGVANNPPWLDEGLARKTHYHFQKQGKIHIQQKK